MAEHPAEPQQTAFSYPGDPDRSGRRDTPYFATPELRQRLDLLRHLTDNSEKILLVKGPQGAGKTTLLQHYRGEAREDWDLCCLQASSQLQPDRFYALLFRRFGINDVSEQGVDHLVRRFEMLAAAGHLPVLVIDDADQLPTATVIAIFRLFERRPGTRALIRVVLFATPEIANLLRTPQLQAMNLQAVQSLELPRLNQDQAQAFVHFLLETSGAPPGLTFGSGRLSRLLKESDGLPGSLESGLRQLLARGSSPQGTPDSRVEGGSAGPRPERRRLAVLADLPLLVVLGAFALVVMLLLALVYQDQVNRLFQEGASEVTLGEKSDAVDGATRELQLPDQAPVPRDEEEAGKRLSDQPESGTISSVEVVPPTLNLPEITAERAPDIVADPGESTGIVAPGQATAPADLPNGMSTDAVVKAEDEEGIVDDTGGDSGELESAGEQASPVVAVSPEVPAIASEVPPAEAEEGAAEPEVAPTEGEAETAPRPETATVRKPANGVVAEESKPATTIKRENWLLARSPSHYTLQLVGVGSESAAIRFIRQHRLQGDVAYFRTVRDGEPWFSVLYGVFPDREAALRGRNRLPSSFRSRDAWPRTFASIHAALKE